MLLLVLGKLLLFGGERFGLRFHLLGPLLAALAQRLQLPLQAVQYLVQFFDVPAASPAGGVRHGRSTLQHADFVAQDGGQPHLFQVGRSTLLVFAAKPIQRVHRLGQFAFGLDQPLGHLAVVLLHRLEGLGVFAQLQLQVARPGTHGRQLPPCAGDLLLQIQPVAPLVFDGRFGRGDPLPVGGGLGLGPMDFLVGRGCLAVDFQQLCLDVFGLGRGGVARIAERAQLALECFEPFFEVFPIDLGDLGPQFLQAVGIFPVSSGLAGLGANAAEPVFHLIDNVAEPQQVLFDAFQPAQGLDLPHLEAADSGRLLKDYPSVARRGLQQDVYLALLDDAVSLGAHARAGE